MDKANTIRNVEAGDGNNDGNSLGWGNGMSDGNRLLRLVKTIGLVLALGASMSASASFLGIGGTSWKEEVLLHDGNKVIVERSVERGGRHEIGQRPSIKNESLTFTLPSTDERVTWKNGFSEDVGFADFMPLALDLFHGVAYVVTTPAGCISYNKWGRPNPPYVVFSYQNRTWQRIALRELPIEIKAPNLIVSSPDDEVEKLGRGFVTVEMIRRANSELTQPEYRTILREALPENRLCPDWSSPRYRSLKAPLPMKPMTDK